jgi:hypothetical protein
VGHRYLAYFAAGDWDAMSTILADDFSNDDRRRVVGSGMFGGREAEAANGRAIAELWTTNVTSAVMAIRGSRLAVSRLGFSGRDEGPDAFLTEMVAVLEINDDERIVACVSFDLDDFDAAMAELDARYLAGEAAAHAHTWSVIRQVYATLNRRELPPTTPDWVNTDHRRGAAFAPGELTAYIRAAGSVMPGAHTNIACVHRLSSLGAVVTHVMNGASQDGFEAEWREIAVLTVDGNLISRCEVFDEIDLDAALAKFDELDGSAP